MQYFDFGMNSNELRKWVLRMQIKDFLGIFAVDQLQHIKPSNLGVLIFNTDIATNVGKHWVGLHIGRDILTLFDPLGYQNLDFSCSYLKRFLKQQNKNIFTNNIQIQANTSFNCGIHCLLFCYIMSKGNARSTFKLFLSQFDLSHISEREQLAIKMFSVISEDNFDHIVSAAPHNS